MSEPQKDNRSASQKIADLENAYMSLFQTVNNMARDMMNFKEAIRLMNSKMNSIVKAASTGQQISDTVIDRLMIENEAEMLKSKVETFVAQGILVAAEQADDNSFIVASEQNDLGETVNPRTQFVLAQLEPAALRDKIKGGKVGDILTLEEGKLKVKLIEIYSIATPAAPVPAPADDQSAPAAPVVGNA